MLCDELLLLAEEISLEFLLPHVGMKHLVRKALVMQRAEQVARLDLEQRAQLLVVEKRTHLVNTVESDGVDRSIEALMLLLDVLHEVDIEVLELISLVVLAQSTVVLHASKYLQAGPTRARSLQVPAESKSALRACLKDVWVILELFHELLQQLEVLQVPLEELQVVQAESTRDVVCNCVLLSLLLALNDLVWVERKEESRRDAVHLSLSELGFPLGKDSPTAESQRSAFFIVKLHEELLEQSADDLDVVKRLLKEC